MRRESTNTSKEQRKSANNSETSSDHSNFEGDSEWWKDISSYASKRKSILQKNTENIFRETSDISTLSKDWWNNLSHDKSTAFTRNVNTPSANDPASEAETPGIADEPRKIRKKLFPKPPSKRRFSSTSRFSNAFMNQSATNRAKIDGIIDEIFVSDVNITGNSRYNISNGKFRRVCGKPSGKRKFSVVVDDSNASNMGNSVEMPDSSSSRRSKRSATPVDYKNSGFLKPVLLDSAEKMTQLIFDKKQQHDLSLLFSVNAPEKNYRKCHSRTPS